MGICGGGCELFGFASGTGRRWDVNGAGWVIMEKKIKPGKTRTMRSGETETVIGVRNPRGCCDRRFANGDILSFVPGEP